MPRPAVQATIQANRGGRMTCQTTSVSLQPVREEESEELVRLRIEAMRDSLERVGRFDAMRARQRFLDGFVTDFTRHILLEQTRVGFYLRHGFVRIGEGEWDIYYERLPRARER